jgi:hypothetical protein
MIAKNTAHGRKSDISIDISKQIRGIGAGKPPEIPALILFYKLYLSYLIVTESWGAFKSPCFIGPLGCSKGLQ